MNINNYKFLILLLISSLTSANVEKRGIKPRKGADPTENLNKTEIVSSSTITTTTPIKRTTPPKIKVVELNKTHMGREGVIEQNHVKLEETAKNNSSSEIDSASINKQKNNNINNNKLKTKTTTLQPSKIPNNNKNKNLNVTIPTTTEGIAKNSSSILKVTTPAPKDKSTLIPSSVKTTIKKATTTTITTTPTTTTTTTTTPEPKKPKFAFSVEDDPSIENVAQTQKVNDNLNKQLIDEPMVQSSRERDSNNFYDRRHDYFIAIISMIFILPLVMGLLIVAYRKFNEFWSTRHYRRMDFLIEGMYD